MKKLYIHGSFMNDNYGDFLLYYVIQNIIEKYEDKYEWFSADVDLSYDKYCKVNRMEKKDAINSADLAIFAGGGYFGEPKNKKIIWNIRCLLKHLIPAYVIYKRNIPYIIVGVEAGPITFKINKFLIKKIFNGAEAISVRNEESKKFLQDINVKNNIDVNPDWIMGINEEDFPIQKINVSNIINKDKNQKVIFIHLTTKNNNNGMKNIVKDLKKYQEKNNNIIYIIGCDQNRKTQKERANLLFKTLDNNKNKILYYQGPWVLSKVLKEVNAVITDKLHVGIVATKYQKEVISVASHPKSVKFYNLIGRNEWSKLLKNIKVNETYQKLNKLQFNSIEVDKKIFEKAKNNKKMVENFLKKN